MMRIRSKDDETRSFPFSSSSSYGKSVDSADNNVEIRMKKNNPFLCTFLRFDVNKEILY